MNTRAIKGDALIESAIQLIGEKGVDRATIHAVCHNANLNEVYIHRVFGGRRELYEAVYDRLDHEFSGHLLQVIPILTTEDGCTIKERFEKFFDDVWEFSLNMPNRCMTFIRLYYSRYYTKEVAQRRKEIYAPVYEAFTPALREGVAAEMVLDRFFDLLFCSALKVLREECPNDENTKKEALGLSYLYMSLLLREDA